MAVRLSVGWRRSLVCALLAMAVTACAKQSEQLWPSVALVPSDRWTAEIPARGPQWWDASIDVRSDVVDGTAATIISSRVEDRPITVHYRDASGAYQRITLQPGESIAVASPPGDVFAII